MRIQSINYINTVNNVSSAKSNSGSRLAFAAQKPDIFVKQATNPAFCGKKVRPEKIEETIKNLDGLHDPYSDILMISKKKFEIFKKRLKDKHDVPSTLGLLKKYKHHMFPTELKMMKIFENNSHNVYKDAHGHTQPTDFHTILTDLKPAAKKRLVKAQIKVVDDMRQLSGEKLGKSARENVESYLTIIEKDIKYDRFRIHSTRNLLARLYDEIPDKKVVDEIMEKSLEFPNSATSTDAFIVKNADRKHQRIAEAMLNPSTVTVEHIKPSSKNGESKAENYIPASKRMNNLRESLSLDKFIDIFPRIPEYTQRTINELIGKINRGGVPELADSLEGVKESLKKESKGKIDLDISSLDPKIQQGTQGFKAKLQDLVTNFNTKKKRKHN